MKKLKVKSRKLKVERSKLKAESRKLKAKSGKLKVRRWLEQTPEDDAGIMRIEELIYFIRGARHLVYKRKKRRAKQVVLDASHYQLLMEIEQALMKKA